MALLMRHLAQSPVDDRVSMRASKLERVIIFYGRLIAVCSTISCTSLSQAKEVWATFNFLV